MRKLVYFMLLITFVLPAFAQKTPATPPTSPTKSSQPLPSFGTTLNPDTVLTEKVQSVIVKTKSLQGQAVTAASYNGVIILEGSVANKAQEQDAINAAKNVPGVKNVKSQLTIKKLP